MLIQPQIKINQLKTKYPKGTKIKLIEMQDPYPIPSGTIGKVKLIDDMGQIHIQWENNSGLALIEGIDKFEIVK